MWFATGTETRASKSNREHKYPRALPSADTVARSQRLLSKKPIRYVYCYLMLKLGPDYLNTPNKNVLINRPSSNRGACRLSGHDRPVPAASAWLRRRRRRSEPRVRRSQEPSLVRSSVLRRNRRRAPGRSIILHQASPHVTQASEGRRAEGAWLGGGCRECDTLRDALCLRVEETRTRLLLGPVSALKLISCYDTVPVLWLDASSVGALSRHLAMWMPHVSQSRGRDADGRRISAQIICASHYSYIPELSLYLASCRNPESCWTDLSLKTFPTWNPSGSQSWHMFPLIFYDTRKNIAALISNENIIL